MEANPYQAPAAVANAPRPRTWFHVIAAFGSWGLALSLMYMTWQIVQEPDWVDRFERNPMLAVSITIVAIGLPISGFVLIGTAAWRCSPLLVWLGLLTFVPLILLTAAMIMWPRK